MREEPMEALRMDEAPSRRLRTSRGARMACLGMVASLALALPARSEAAPDAAHCIRYWGEARYGALAYKHIVHVANDCLAVADCVVSTDVSPEPQAVVVAGQSETSVVMFMGSPARTFEARVHCTMRD